MLINQQHNYFVYIATNYNRTVLYTGVTNDLTRRLKEHQIDAQTSKRHFTGKYNVYFLIYCEMFQYVRDAIRREKEIKGWTRKRKEELINKKNPEWKFLNNIV